MPTRLWAGRCSTYTNNSRMLALHSLGPQAHRCAGGARHRWRRPWRSSGRRPQRRPERAPGLWALRRHSEVHHGLKTPIQTPKYDHPDLVLGTPEKIPLMLGNPCQGLRVEGCKLILCSAFALQPASPPKCSCCRGKCQPVRNPNSIQE